jgi:acetyltransferase-like isoleucine patch superfamily enzyme
MSRAHHSASGPSHLALPDWVTLGEGAEIDPGVLIGYLSGRGLSDRSTVLGRGARLRSGTVVYAGTRIGDGLDTGHGVIIREENELGDGVSIWNHSTVDYGCRIGSRVKIHCNVYVAQFTTIEDDVFLAPGVTIANDPHPICTLCMRGPTLRRGARIGVNVTLLPFVTVGENALIGAGSVVTRDIPDGVLAYGNPATVIKPLSELDCPYGLVDRPYVDGLDVYRRSSS